METFILLPYMDPAPGAKPSQLLNELNRVRIFGLVRTQAAL